MHQAHPLREVIDLTDPTRNVLFNATLEGAREAIAEGDPDRVRAIDGHFALVARRGEIVRMARSLSVPMRYFIVKRVDGPARGRRLAEINLSQTVPPRINCSCDPLSSRSCTRSSRSSGPGSGEASRP